MVGVHMYRALKERFKRLQKGPFRFLVAFVASIHESIKHLSPVLISFDKEGDWHNHRRNLTIVSNELNVHSLSAVRSRVMDVWCYDYKLQEGDTVIDIGAGIGDEAVIFSRLVGESGRVIAIEAHPGIFRCLLKTIAANHLKNVIALNVAISHQEGEVTISDEDNYLSNKISEDQSGIQIRAEMLDNTLKEIGVSNPSLIKMNIEGAERFALLGMRKTLGVAKHIVVSCHDFVADNYGGDESMRTYNTAKEFLRDENFTLRDRSDDVREEIKYLVYGKKK